MRMRAPNVRSLLAMWAGAALALGACFADVAVEGGVGEVDAAAGDAEPEDTAAEEVVAPDIGLGLTCVEDDECPTGICVPDPDSEAMRKRRAQANFELLSITDLLPCR